MVPLQIIGIARFKDIYYCEGIAPLQHSTHFHVLSYEAALEHNLNLTDSDITRGELEPYTLWGTLYDEE